MIWALEDIPSLIAFFLPNQHTASDGNDNANAAAAQNAVDIGSNDGSLQRYMSTSPNSNQTTVGDVDENNKTIGSKQSLEDNGDNHETAVDLEQDEGYDRDDEGSGG